KQGAQLVNPKVEIFEDMVGTGPDAWDNPTKAQELAEAQYKKGADVIFAAAGASGIGVLKASSLAPNRYSIGVDSNQNGLFPGHVLTSMIKKVDVAVYSGLLGVAKGSWDAGILNLGLKENAVSYAVDEHNEPLLEPGMVAKVENARQQIIDGTLEVKMYTPSR
ncbi:MAG: BMP family ABC transporter substrate-binding protein, partial [Alphaproteobacteria bacterium]|nr:BMP family ABC transporter substrate-binding protein [Alphaproteobacteria bacterium]